MRAFQPIARRTEAERNRNLWTPPPAVRTVAWCIQLGSFAYMIANGWRLAVHFSAVENNPDYALSHTSHTLPFYLVAGLVGMLLSMPFVIPHGPREMKKHIPDPALSIRPR